MRYPAPEKPEIIRPVEQSHPPVRATLDKPGLTRSTFYRWYDAYQRGGPEAAALVWPTAPRGRAGCGSAYSHVRAHESLDNLTPSDVCLGRGADILRERARIKRQTLIDRRLRHHAQAA